MHPQCKRSVRIEELISPTVQDTPIFSPIIMIGLKMRKGYVNKVVAGFPWGYFVTGYYIRE